MLNHEELVDYVRYADLDDYVGALLIYSPEHATPTVIINHNVGVSGSVAGWLWRAIKEVKVQVEALDWPARLVPMRFYFESDSFKVYQIFGVSKIYV